MPECIMTRANVSAEAMQFEGTQKNVDNITEWINEYDHRVTVMWNGNDSVFTGDMRIKAEPGLLELYVTDQLHDHVPMEASPGDWVVKSSRDTFYTVQQKEFNEIWEVIH